MLAAVIQIPAQPPREENNRVMDLICQDLYQLQVFASSSVQATGCVSGRVRVVTLRCRDITEEYGYCRDSFLHISKVTLKILLNLTVQMSKNQPTSHRK